jgi:3-hydroxyacyl-[acyl-carrier-protein] dehydratase
MNSAVPSTTAVSLDPELLRQIRDIVRRDLKLPPDEPIPEDMPFFGGSVDLDSLDMLLLLTSIERQFGVKIPNETIGKEVFRDLASLGGYIQRQRAAGNGAAKTDWLSRLPHGPEFRFVTRVDEVRPGQMARGAWALSGQEPFLAGHFPGSPIVPGVLIVEALAQMSGFAGPSESSANGKIAHVDVRFEQSASPPVEITLNAKLVRALGSLQVFDVSAEAGSTVLARGSITLHRERVAKPMSETTGDASRRR